MRPWRQLHGISQIEESTRCAGAAHSCHCLEPFWIGRPENDAIAELFTRCAHQTTALGSAELRSKYYLGKFGDACRLGQMDIEARGSGLFLVRSLPISG